MQLVYTGRTPSDAHFCAARLAECGVPSELRGEPLWQSHEPRLSSRRKPTTVWVADDDVARAAECVRGFVAVHAADLDETPCPACGEPGPSRFDVCWSCGASREAVAARSAADANPLDDSLAIAAERGVISAPATPTPPPRTVEESSVTVGNDHVVDEPKPCEPPVPDAPVPDATLSPWNPDAHPPVSVLTCPWGLLLTSVACLLIWHGLSHEAQPNSDPAMEHWGWRSAHDVWGGAWWSLFAASFVHADRDHCLDNLLWLWVFGLRLEHALRPGKWLLFLAVAGFVSGAVDQAWLGEHSYGASGLVYAVFGAFLVAGIPRRLVPWWVHLPLCLWFLLTSVVYDLQDVYDELLGREILDPVANVCHLSGFAAGCLVGLMMVGGTARRVGVAGFAALTIAAFVPLVWAPWSSNWCVDRGDVARKQHREEAALAWYDRAIRLRPDDPAAFIRRAELAYDRNDFEAALADANRAVELEETLIRNFEQQQREAAPPDDGQGENGNPDSPASSTTGVVRLPDAAPKKAPPGTIGEGDAPKPAAEAPSQKADPHRAPTSPLSPPEADPVPKSTKATGAAFLLRGQIHGVLCRYAEADQDLTRSLAISPDSALARTLRAGVRWEQARYAEALDDLSQAQDQAPHAPWIRLVRGAVLREAGEALAARDELERVIEAYAKQAEGDAPDPFALSCLAWAHDEVDEPETAEEYATKALGLSPYDWDMLARRANVRVRLKRPKEALEDAERSLRINARNIFALCVKGDALASLNRDADALQEFAKAIEINPRYPRAFLGRGGVRRKTGDRRGALDDLNRSLDLNPRSAAAYLERSRVYSELRDRPRARSDRQTAQALDPTVRTTDKTEDEQPDDSR